jgi:hypothetical protein
MGLTSFLTRKGPLPGQDISKLYLMHYQQKPLGAI